VTFPALTVVTVAAFLSRRLGLDLLVSTPA
jgi:hypothetical protein